MGLARVDSGCPNRNHGRISAGCNYCRIVVLLRTLPEVLGGLVYTPSGLEVALQGDGPGVPGLPPVYHEGGYKRLERAIAKLRETHPSEFRHLLARYRDCDRRTYTRAGGIAGGERFYVRDVVLAEKWPSWVQMLKVEGALELLSRELGTVKLPKSVSEIQGAKTAADSTPEDRLVKAVLEKKPRPSGGHERFG
jgi:hypothetical protein